MPRRNKGARGVGNAEKTFKLMKKILLLNPPGKNLYIRDYYCSKISQANYISQPIDLLIISANLRKINCEIKLIDGIVQNYSAHTMLAQIKDYNPDYIITLTGAVSWDEDVEFFKALKNNLNCKLVASGDILLENPDKYLKELSIFDAIITDFTSKSVIDYIESDRNDKLLLNADTSNSFDLAGTPYHEEFLKIGYRYPFTTSKKYCSVLTEFGCPYKCSFCIMGKIKYKIRPEEKIIEELKYIKSLNVKEVFFVDQTFGANKNKTNKLLKDMIETKLGISWFGFSRVDVLNEEVLKLMKTSGCHTLILGIESGSEKILESYRKGYTKEDILRTLAICKKLKIRTVGTFIFGLPDETAETAQETLQFIKTLPLDYASFNVAVPRAGTELREQALSLGLIKDDFITMDQSGTKVAMSTKQLTQKEIKKIKQKAIIAFYLRPGYLIGRLMKIRSFYEFIQNILNAYYLLKRGK